MNVASRIYWGASGTLIVLSTALLLPVSSFMCTKDVIVYMLCLAWGSSLIWIAALCKEKEK